MSERALRGTRLVVTSYETDRGIDLAPRQAVEYACEKGHRFEMPFSVEAEIPHGLQRCRAGKSFSVLVGVIESAALAAHVQASTASWSPPGLCPGGRSPPCA